MRNIITILYIGCISLFFITPHKTSAQWVCYYTPGPEYYTTTQGVGCDNWYHYAPHPDMDMIPVKYIRMAYHIIQDENGANNIPNTYQGRNHLGLILNEANSSLRNLETPRLDSGYVWPPITSPYITDSRIQFYLDTIYFHRDSLLWDWNVPWNQMLQLAYSSYSKFVANNPNLNLKQKYQTLHVIIGGGSYEPLGGVLNYFEGKTFITQNGMLKKFNDSNHWDPAGNLIHEFGHYAGLGHNFHGGTDGNQCDDCGDNDPADLPCPIQGTSNNRMDYPPGAGNSFSQCQIGKMHYSFSGNAGTFETVINNDCDVAGDAFVIETGRNVVWNHHNTMAGDLILEPGSVLTIRCTIKMKSQSKIVVKRGAQLIIDEGIITSACSEAWHGIEVWGNTALRQIPPSNQGWVRIINGGTIEKAVMGIYTNRTNEETGRWVPGYTGGIVQATDAKFINNVRAVQFFPYENYSLSSFTACEFVSDGNRPQGQVDAYFATIFGIKGIAFTACSFLNQSGLEHYQSGIRSVNSFVRIQGKCLDIFEPCINWEYSKFEGLKYGVYATATSPTRYVDIRHTEFKENFRSLYVGGITNARVTTNRFIINTPFVENGGYGTYLDGCTGYLVEDNDFKHDGAIPTGIGLIVNNSGTDPNEIYRNRFEKLEMGISAQGINRNPATGVGLQILCNDFVFCNADLLIAIPNQENNRGIAANQGAFSTDPKKMAGNLFHIPSQIPNGDFDDINNAGVHITYYYPSIYESGYQRVEPVDYTESTVTKVMVPFSLAWSPATGCPSRLEGGNGGMPTESLIEQITGSQHKIDSTHQVIALLIDGGHTTDLQRDIYMSFPSEAMQVYNALMSKSPYLSDTVVSTAIVKEQVLPGAMIRDMMVANPHTAKSEALMEKLDRRWMPLPDYMKAQILQGKSIVSVKEQTESRMARFTLEKARAVNAFARVYYENTDSLAWLWGIDNSLSSKYNLAFLLLERISPDQGVAIMNSIPQQFALTTAQQTTHQQLVGLYSLLSFLIQEEKSIFDSDSTQLLSIATMESAQAGIASVYARNFLLTLGMLEYDEPILLPDLLKSKSLAQRHKALKSTEGQKHLNIFPNPSSGYIIAEYMLPAQGDGVIEFTDMSGKRIHILTLKRTQDQLMVDVRRWKPGLYLATLKTGTKISQNVKFTITD